MENAARFGSRYPEKMRQLGSLYKGLMNRPDSPGDLGNGIVEIVPGRDQVLVSVELVVNSVEADYWELAN